MSKKISSLFILSLLSLLLFSASTVQAAFTITNVNGSFGSFTSLALDDNGLPVIGYQINGDLAVVRCGNLHCTAGNTIAYIDLAGTLSRMTKMVLDADGFPVISYVQATNNTDNTLKLAHCGNANCTANNTITTITENQYYLSHSLVLDANGNPIIVNNRNRTLELIHCGDPNCTTGNVFSTIDNVGWAGGNSSLVLDANGNPVISYYDANGRSLNVVHCGDPNCSSGNIITTIDNEGLGSGESSSLVLDANGNPVIGYNTVWEADPFTGTKGDAKLVHCGNPSCTADNVITVLDIGAEYGITVSLALDANNNPIVGIVDYGVDLKVLYCGDSNCTISPAFTRVDTDAYYISMVLDSDDNPVFSYRQLGANTSAAIKLARTQQPEITVADSAGTTIANGGTFAFVQTTTGAAISETMTISNSGVGDLVVSSLPAITGSGDISVSSLGATTLASGETTTFTVTCNGTSAGTQIITLSFTNNDVDNNPYVVTINCIVNPAVVSVTNLDINVIGFPVTGSTDIELIEWVVTVVNGSAGQSQTVDLTLDIGMVFGSVDDANLIVNSNGQVISITTPALNPGEVYIFSVFVTAQGTGEVLNATGCFTDTLICSTGQVVRMLPNTGESHRHD